MRAQSFGLAGAAVVALFISSLVLTYLWGLSLDSACSPGAPAPVLQSTVPSFNATVLAEVVAALAEFQAISSNNTLASAQTTVIATAQQMQDLNRHAKAFLWGTVGSAVLGILGGLYVGQKGVSGVSFGARFLLGIFATTLTASAVGGACAITGMLMNVWRGTDHAAVLTRTIAAGQCAPTGQAGLSSFYAMGGERVEPMALCHFTGVGLLVLYLIGRIAVLVSDKQRLRQPSMRATMGSRPPGGPRRYSQSPHRGRQQQQQRIEYAGRVQTYAKVYADERGMY